MSKGVAVFVCSGLVGLFVALPMTSVAAARRPVAKDSCLRAVSPEVEDFLNRFPVFDSARLSDRYRRSVYRFFLNSLATVDFNLSEPVRVQMPERRYAFVIDPRLIGGWKNLGLVGADGRFNFKIDGETLWDSFARQTGFQRARSPGAIIDARRYFSYIRRGEFFLDDIHGILFHMPYLLDPVRRETLRAALEVVDLDTALQVTRTVSNAEYNQRLMSIFDYFFEGDTANEGQPIDYALGAGDRFLFGVLQLEIGPGEVLQLDARREYEALKANLNEATIYFSPLMSSPDTNLESRLFLLALAQEIKNWLRAYEIAHRNGRPGPTITVNATPKEAGMAGALVSSMERNPKILADPAAFKKQATALMNKLLNLVRELEGRQ